MATSRMWPSTGWTTCLYCISGSRECTPATGAVTYALRSLRSMLWKWRSTTSGVRSVTMDRVASPSWATHERAWGRVGVVAVRVGEGAHHPDVQGAASGEPAHRHPYAALGVVDARDLGATPGAALLLQAGDVRAQAVVLLPERCEVAGERVGALADELADSADCPVHVLYLLNGGWHFCLLVMWLVLVNWSLAG